MTSIAKAHLVPGLCLIMGLVFFIADLAYSNRFDWHVRPDGLVLPNEPEVVLKWPDDRWEDSDEGGRLGMNGARFLIKMMIVTILLFLPILALMLSATFFYLIKVLQLSPDVV